jgi:hypothetical protein
MENSGLVSMLMQRRLTGERVERRRACTHACRPTIIIQSRATRA